MEDFNPDEEPKEAKEEEEEEGDLVRKTFFYFTATYIDTNNNICSDVSYPVSYHCIYLYSCCILLNHLLLIEHSFSRSFLWRFVDSVCFIVCFCLDGQVSLKHIVQMENSTSHCDCINQCLYSNQLAQTQQNNETNCLRSMLLSSVVNILFLD